MWNSLVPIKGRVQQRNRKEGVADVREIATEKCGQNVTNVSTILAAHVQGGYANTVDITVSK